MSAITSKMRRALSMSLVMLDIRAGANCSIGGSDGILSLAATSVEAIEGSATAKPSKEQFQLVKTCLINHQSLYPTALTNLSRLAQDLLPVASSSGSRKESNIGEGLWIKVEVVGMNVGDKILQCFVIDWIRICGKAEKHVEWRIPSETQCEEHTS